MHGSMESYRNSTSFVSGHTFDGTLFSIALEKERAIGNGSTAQIYKGRLLDHEPLVVAVKMFGQMLSPVQQKELLVRELRLAREVSFRHHAILGFLGMADIEPQTALVSLYMRNGNLLEYLKANPACDKRKLILEVADAVNFLHSEARLVHGDLKCANVLISDYGDALLADFGLSAFVEKSLVDFSTMTSLRTMNTLQFAAPELLMEQSDPLTRPRSKTFESDVYAFGMLFLEAVTEAPPWKPLNNLTILMRVCIGERPPRPLREALVSLSHAAWEVCLSCWRHEPSDRPSMRDILNALKVYEIEPIKIISSPDVVVCIAYMPSGLHVVSGSSSGSISIWDIRTGLVLVGPMRGHVSHILCVAVSSDGRRLASTSGDCTIRLWDAVTGTIIIEPIRLREAAFCIAYSPDGCRFAYGEGNDGYLRDATTGAALGVMLQVSQSLINAVAFSSDGILIAFGSDDGIIRLLDSTTGMQLASLAQPQNDGGVHSLAFSADRVHLAAGYRSGGLRICNVSGPFLEAEIEGVASNARTVAISPTGRYVAGGGCETISIWDVQNGRLVGQQPGAYAPSGTSVAFAPDGRSVVACAQGGGILIWDLFE